jgi:hypothetical protein
MGKASAPPPPDYESAAKATAAGNLEAAKYGTVANRATQINPYGKVSWQRGATDYDPWTQTTELSEVGQKQFDLQNDLQTKFGETANTGFDKVRGIFENPNIDQSLIPKAPINAGMTAQQAMMSRLQPTLDRNDDALRTRLANQGISLGSTAYNREQNLAGQNANDLYLQSAMQGIGLDQNARKDALNEAYAAQSRPLDLINSLRTGNQVQSPQFSNYAQQATTQGPDMLNAANMKYGAEMDAVNAQNEATSGLIGGIAGIGLGMAGMPGAGGSMIKGAKGLFRS